MAYKYSKGERKFNDIKAENDSDGDTLIDFEEDYIALKTNGANRIKISGSDGEVTFNEAGDYGFQCDPHAGAGMKGVIHVK